MKRDELIEMIRKYYETIGRVKTPQYQNYSLSELKSCIRMFGLKFVEK